MEPVGYACYFRLLWECPFLIGCERTMKDAIERIHDIRLLCTQYGCLEASKWPEDIIEIFQEDLFQETRKRAEFDLDKLFRFSGETNIQRILKP